MIWWWVPCGAGRDCPVRWHVAGADEVRRHPLSEGEPGWGQGRVTCPECGLGSPSGDDRVAGYCGNCHWWTSEPELWQVKRGELAARRELARRYHVERIEPGLVADGVPAEAAAVLRRRYVRGVLGNPRALARLDEWARQGGHSGG